MAHALDAIIPAAQTAAEQLPDIASDPSWYERIREGVDVAVNRVQSAEDAVVDGAINELEEKYGGGFNTVRDYVIGAFRYGPLFAVTYTLAAYDHLYNKGASALRKKQKIEKLKKELQSEAPAQQLPTEAPQDPTLPSAQEAYGASASSAMDYFQFLVDDDSDAAVREVLAGRLPTQSGPTKQDAQDKEPDMDFTQFLKD